MKHKISIILMLVLMSILPEWPVSADTTTINGITWTYTVSNGSASLGGPSSSDRAVPTSTEGAITIPSTLSGYHVTSIGARAFFDCSSLTSVTMPDSVTSIGQEAFHNCNGLTNVTIGVGVKSIGHSAFSSCSGLTRVSIPNAVTVIDSFAFSRCSGLTSVTIGKGVANIGSYAFSHCSELTNILVTAGNAKYSSVNGLLLSKDGTTLIQGVNGNVTIPDGVRNIGEFAFRFCSGLTNVMIPDSVTSIDYYAFSDCDGLTNVMVGNGVTSIGSYAFSSCSGLMSVVIGNDVININPSAFSQCTELTNILVSAGNANYSSSAGLLLSKDGTKLIQGNNGNVTIPGSVTSIGSMAFFGRNKLMSVTIPSSVTNIEDHAFYGCSGLMSVSIPDGVTSIGSFAFSNCSGLTSVTIPDGITVIGQGTFRYCNSLTSVSIPDGVTNIGSDAFRGCSSLTSASIPVGVTNIDHSAFYESGLTCVMIPNSVANIVSYAFSGCNNLTSVTIGNSVTKIGSCAFSNCSRLVNVTFYGIAPSGISESDILSSAESVRYREEYTNSYEHFVPASKFAGYALTIDEILNIELGDVVWGGDALWFGDYDVSHDGKGSMRSGAIENNGESWIETKVNGPVRLSFWWKASSEEYDGEVFDYAHLSLDGEPQGTLSDYQLQGIAIGGKTGWTNVVFDITEEGEHTVRWTYKKDEVDESDVGEDCVWLDEVSLDPLATVSFSLGGGEGTAPAPVNAFMRTKIVLPTTAGFGKAKHTFVGWNDGAETFGAGAEYVVTNTSVAFTAIWRANTLSAPVIASADVADGGILQGGAATVSITAEAGAKIRYTLDGSVPTAASVSYDGPLVLDGLSVQIRAIAVRDNYFDSPVAEFVFTRAPENSADSLNVPGMNVAMDATASWYEVTGAAAHDGVAALRSGAIGDGESPYIEMTVIGAGEVGFWWKSSSEISRNRKYDYVSFLVDGEERSWLGGEKDWTNEVFSVTGDGAHTLRWVYQKNENGMTQGEDCAWLDEVTWTPSDPLPEITGAGEIRAVLARAGDEVRLRKSLTSVAGYEAFRAWADQNSLDHQAVKDSVHAWASFALGANQLFLNEPEIKIEGLSVATSATLPDGGEVGGGQGAPHPTMTVFVTVKDGGETVMVNAEKVTAMLEATTDLADWTGAAKVVPVVHDIIRDEHGVITFAVTPQGSSSSFFLRVRVK